MMDDSCKVLVPSYIVGIGSRVVVVIGLLELKLKLVKVEHSCCNVGWVTIR